MALKLEKTFLSQRPGPKSFLLGFLSLLAMFAVMGHDVSALTANGNAVFAGGEYWKAFTTTFVHADLEHLSHNAFFFTGLAILLNGYFGFLAFPLMSFAAGGLVNLITLSYYPEHISLVGVSGVVYFMAAFWLTLFVLIERKKSLRSRLIYAVGMALIFFFPETFRPQVSYLAHLFGFLLGVPAAVLYFGLNFRKIRAQELWVEKHPEPEENIIVMMPDPETEQNSRSENQ